ncbi:MAG: GntR family transcriptional regulator [Butyricicoccus sp.]|nr:GntR family transcriptional regulator [Butyricicoccus sp.]
MAWTFSGDRPIYAQLVEQLQTRIVTGVYPPGSRMEAVRELANDAAVNPNTMQRAMSELERRGLVFSQRTSGRYVTDDPESIAALRGELAREKIDRFLGEMRKLGYEKSEIIAILEKEERV